MSDTREATVAERAAAFLAGTGGDRGWEHELLTALAHQAAPVRRVTAEVRDHLRHIVHPSALTADDIAAALSMTACEGGIAIVPPIVERLLTCPECGGTVFGYAENCVDYRTPGGQEIRDDGGVVAVDWHADGTAESGDSEPGLFCDHWRGGGCGVAIDLPEGWEVVYG